MANDHKPRAVSRLGECETSCGTGKRDGRPVRLFFYICPAVPLSQENRVSGTDYKSNNGQRLGFVATAGHVGHPAQCKTLTHILSVLALKVFTREHPMITPYSRRAAQHAQLIADGRKALQLIKVRPIADVLLVVGGSRARLYRAMAAASADARDPLLE